MTLHSALDHAGGRPTTLLIRGAQLLDPRIELDRRADLLIRDGEIAEMGEGLEAPEGAEVVEAAGLHSFPGFVDPHVHLRTPGREDEEDLDSGTRAAAAGGFCAILAMPNTEPVVDSAPVLRSLRERARAEARVPTGFLAAITRGQAGEGLTEMAELADAAPLLAAGRARPHAPRHRKDAPAAAHRAGSPGADRGAPVGDARLRGHRPRPARARGKGAAVRARADGRDRSRDSFRGAQHR